MDHTMYMFLWRTNWKLYRNSKLWQKIGFLKFTKIPRDILKSNTNNVSLKVGVFWQLCDYIHLHDTVAASDPENTLGFFSTKCMGMFYLLWITWEVAFKCKVLESTQLCSPFASSSSLKFTLNMEEKDLCVCGNNLMFRSIHYENLLNHGTRNELVI